MKETKAQALDMLNLDSREFAVEVCENYNVSIVQIRRKSL